MVKRKTTLNPKYLAVAVAVAVAVLAVPAQALAATSGRGSATSALRVESRAANAKPGSDHLARNQPPPKQSPASYFWADAGIAASVLVGLVVLGLWGDVAIGGLILGVAALGAGAKLIARKACTPLQQSFRGRGTVGFGECRQGFRGVATRAASERLRIARKRA